MEISWSRDAVGDLGSLYDFIERDNPEAARRMVLRIVETVERLLADHPSIGRPGRVPRTRELPIAGTPYIVPYRVKDGVLQILRVYHGARRWPDRF